MHRRELAAHRQQNHRGDGHGGTRSRRDAAFRVRRKRLHAALLHPDSAGALRTRALHRHGPPYEAAAGAVPRPLHGEGDKFFLREGNSRSFRQAYAWRISDARRRVEPVLQRPALRSAAALRRLDARSLDEARIAALRRYDEGRADEGRSRDRGRKRKLRDTRRTELRPVQRLRRGRLVAGGLLDDGERARLRHKDQGHGRRFDAGRPRARISHR